jgi:hypothetical protein
MVVGDAASLLPAGSVQTGWTSEHGGFDTRPTLEAIAREITAAEHPMPGLGGFPFAGTWAALCPMTPSARPAIGRVQALDGLYAATGQYTDGVIPGHQPEKVRELLLHDGPGRAALARYDTAGVPGRNRWPRIKPGCKAAAYPAAAAHRLPAECRTPRSARAPMATGQARTSNQNGGSARNYKGPRTVGDSSHGRAGSGPARIFVHSQRWT